MVNLRFIWLLDQGTLSPPRREFGPCSVQVFGLNIWEIPCLPRNIWEIPCLPTNIREIPRLPRNIRAILCPPGNFRGNSTLPEARSRDVSSVQLGHVRSGPTTRHHKRTAKPQSAKDSEGVSETELHALTRDELLGFIKKEHNIALEQLRQERAAAGKPRPARLKPGWTNDKVVRYKKMLDSMPHPARVPSSKKAGAGNKGDGGNKSPASIRVGRAPNPHNTHKDANNDDRDGDDDPDDDGDVQSRETTASLEPHSSTDEGIEKHRPGPLTGKQRRECADMSDSLVLWMEEKARVWGVSISSIAHALGLHNTETRATTYWNKHQARFYAEEKRRPGETLDEHRERCHEAYLLKSGEDNSATPTCEQRAEIEAWRDDLDTWWTKHEVEQAQGTVRAGQRYKVMLDLRKELSEKAQFMSQRFQVEMIVAAVTGAPDDAIARNASFVVAGSTRTRTWFDTGNVHTAMFLGDFETLVRGDELKSRSKRGAFNLGTFSAEFHNRDARNSAVTTRLKLLLNTATGIEMHYFPWQDIGGKLIESMHTLINWPPKTPYPGGLKPIKALGTEGFRRLYLRLEEANDDNRDPDTLLSFVPWSDAQSRLDEDDPEYANIPLVVTDTGEVLLRLGDVNANKTAALKRNLKKKLTGARNALHRFQDGQSDAHSVESEDGDTSSRDGSGPAPAVSDLVDDGWMDGHGEVAVAKHRAKDAKRRARSPPLHSKDKGKGKARTKKSKRRRSSSRSASPNANITSKHTSKRTRTGPPNIQAPIAVDQASDDEAQASRPRPKPTPTWATRSPNCVTDTDNNPRRPGGLQERPWIRPSPPRRHGDNLAGGGLPFREPSVAAPVPQPFIRGISVPASRPPSGHAFNPHQVFSNQSQAGPSSQRPQSRDGHDVTYGPIHRAQSRPPSRPPSRPLGHTLHRSSVSPHYYVHGTRLPRNDPPSGVHSADFLLSAGRITPAQHEYAMSRMGHSNGNFYSGPAHMYGPRLSNEVGMGTSSNTEHTYYNPGLPSGFDASASSQGWMGGHMSVQSDAAMESLFQSGAFENLPWDPMEPIME